MIAEAQLITWSSQGPTGQFTDTYQRIRDNLLDRSAPYPLKDTKVFLQGSYRNDTNVYGDSDVDIVLYHTGAFYRDVSRLSAADREAYDAAYAGVVQYGYGDFKLDATKAGSTTKSAPARRRSIFRATTTVATLTCSSHPNFDAITNSSHRRISDTQREFAFSLRVGLQLRTSRSSTPITAQRSIRLQTAGLSILSASSRTCGTP